MDQTELLIKQIQKGKALPPHGTPAQIGEIEALHGTEFENCEPYLKQSYQTWFKDVWRRDTQTNHGKAFINNESLRDRTILIIGAVTVFMNR